MSSLATERAKKAIMAERSPPSTWKTKKRQRESAARMREIKRAKLSSPTTGHGSSSSEPTPSGSSAPVRPDPDPSEASSDDEGTVHSESENERGASESSSGEDVSDFDSEKAQGIFDDWVVSLPLQSRKMLYTSNTSVCARARTHAPIYR